MEIMSICAMVLLLASVTGADNFNFPPDANITPDNYNLSTAFVFKVGDQQQFLWTTTVPFVRLALWQNGQPGVEEVLSAKCSEEQFIWNGHPAQDLNNGNLFFLQLYDSSLPKPSNPLATSRYFNYTDPSPSSPTSTNPSQPSSSMSSFSSSASSSSALDASVGSQPASSTTGALAGSPPGILPSFPNTDTSQSKTSDGVKIGVGVGVGVGIGLTSVAALIALYLYQRQTKQTVSSNSNNDWMMSDRSGIPLKTELHAHYSTDTGRYAELPAQSITPHQY